MKLITFALASFYGVFVVSAGQLQQCVNKVRLLPNHSRLIPPRTCQVIYKKWEVETIENVLSIEDCEKKVQEVLQLKMPEACDRGFFLDYQSMIDEAKSDEEQVTKFVYGVAESCSVQIFRFDHRIKMFNSLKDKHFDRILNKKNVEPSEFYKRNMNDIIGYRFHVRSSDDAFKLSECFRLSNDKYVTITNTRSTDHSVYYASGDLPKAPSHGYPGEKAIFEIQIWPVSVGEDMVWGHGVTYKQTDITDPIQLAKRMEYRYRVGLAANCMQYPEFFEHVLGGINTLEDLRTWLREDCRGFLKKLITSDREPPVIIFSEGVKQLLEQTGELDLSPIEGTKPYDIALDMYGILKEGKQPIQLQKQA